MKDDAIDQNKAIKKLGQNSNHSTGESENDYSALVESLDDLLSSTAVEKSAQNSGLADLQHAILRSTAELPQHLESTSTTDTASRSLWQRLSEVFNRLSRPIPALAMTLLMAGMVTLGIQMQTPSVVTPQIASQPQDADLTFQELWLIEDEYLFAGEI